MSFQKRFVAQVDVESHQQKNVESMPQVRIIFRFVVSLKQHELVSKRENRHCDCISLERFVVHHKAPNFCEAASDKLM